MITHINIYLWQTNGAASCKEYLLCSTFPLLQIGLSSGMRTDVCLHIHICICDEFMYVFIYLFIYLFMVYVTAFQQLELCAL